MTTPTLVVERTRGTARLMGRLERAGQASVNGFAFIVERILWCCAHVVFAVERLRRDMDKTLSGDRFIDGHWYLVCRWCGSRTAEQELLPHACCRLESRELLRQLRDRRR